MAETYDFVKVFEARERREAARRGITVEELRAMAEAEKAAQLREHEARQRARRLGPVADRLTVPMFDAIVAGERLDDTPALEAVHDWQRAADRAPVLVLMGGTGAGKTVACAAAMSGRSGAEYVRAADLAVRHEPYSGDLARGVAPLNMSAPLLIVDDLGTEKRTDARFAPALLDVVDGRMRLDTILVTNLSRRDFMETYAKDERMRSRLAQLATFEGCGRADLRRSGWRS